MTDNPTPPVPSHDWGMPPHVTATESGTLDVRVFDYEDVDGTGMYDEARHSRMHNAVGVTLEPVEGGERLQKSTQDGGAEWSRLPIGQYRLHVSPSPGYRTPTHYSVQVDQNVPEQKAMGDHISIHPDTVTRVYVGYSPEPIQIHTVAFVDDNGSGNPDGQPPMCDLPIKIYRGRGDDLLDVVRTTSPTGEFSYSVKRMGVVRVVPPLVHEGRRLSPALELPPVNIAPRMDPKLMALPPIAYVGRPSEPHTIRWQVLSKDRRPLKAMWVELRAPGGEHLEWRQTDEDGWARFDVSEAGEYELRGYIGYDRQPLRRTARVHSEWVVTDEADLTADEWALVEIDDPFTLVSITGRLVAPAGINPSGAIVRARRIAGEFANPFNDFPVTNTGEFTISANSNDTIAIHLPLSLADAKHPEMVLSSSSVVFLQPTADCPLGDFNYAPQAIGTTISGRVMRVLGSAAEPFPKCTVKLRASGQGPGATIVDSAVTSDSGEFSLATRTPTGNPATYTLVLDRDVSDGEGTVTRGGPSDPLVVVLAGQTAVRVPDIVYSRVGAVIIGQVTDGSRGLAGVSVELFDPNATSPTTASTDAQGFYEFSRIAPGAYELLFRDRVVDASGRIYEIDQRCNKPSTLYVSGRSVSPSPTPVVYQLEKHAVAWTVTTRDGDPVPDRLVQVVDPNANNAVVGSAFTDARGCVFIELDQAYPKAIVRTWPSDTNLPPLEETVSVQSTARGATVVPGGVGDGRGGGTAGVNPTPIQESAIDLTAYPILTEPINPAALPSGPSGGGGGGTSLGQLAEGAIRDVLNWRPKNDPKAFQAALGQSFSLTDVEGHTEWKWTPRSYTVQTDLGAVTGAQASLYTRARTALDQALPLLEGLSPLRRDVQDEDLQSMRDVVRGELTQLVNEFGVLGGPRVQRIDELFRLLLGDQLVTDPQQIPASSELGILGNRFGMESGRVNTIDDEQNLTNYLILVDYTISLRQSWLANRRYFDGTPNVEPFLGTQLVVLSRDLEVVAESVHDVAFAMDSVFLGPAERSALQLDFSSIQRPPLFVADLLDWVDRFASSEGPMLIQSSGKDGINAFKPVVADLVRHVRAALTGAYGGNQTVAMGPIGGNGPTGTNGVRPRGSVVLPPGYGTPRVQRALQSLADQLAATQQHAGVIAAPSLLGDPAALPLPAGLEALPQQMAELQQQLAGLRRLVRGMARPPESFAGER
jgi:hypothetical protein